MKMKLTNQLQNSQVIKLRVKVPSVVTHTDIGHANCYSITPNWEILYKAEWTRKAELWQQGKHARPHSGLLQAEAENL